VNAEQFIARLRARITPKPLVPLEPLPAPPPATLARFETELRATRGMPSRVRAADVADEVVRIATAEKAGSFVTWSTPPFERFGLDALERAGLSRVVLPAPPADPRPAIETADLGVIASDLAIAENGSVVLTTGPGRPRLVAALPRTLVVLLHDLRLLASLEELAEVMAARPAPVTHVLINGPSCTADVKTEDLRPVEGMHGPHAVHVVTIVD
jgi:L-lactate utilization protein LutC